MHIEDQNIFFEHMKILYKISHTCADSEPSKDAYHYTMAASINKLYQISAMHSRISSENHPEAGVNAL
ncbi:hypothetical protein A359_04690 [secondary endosymbiont of Ctenarytaina eucalypti]|uniref:Uncharacterized protein n=1 Tax=secondary endosymbiont of Ctenarytaina eucalypti TaxID=1199245 RepID=J3TFC2_9ENTR|nr:hypothetical protein A359_04690 [secondary endosymbiont of Ctenarytaina eucalypti]